MALKDILLHLDAGAAGEARLALASELARRHQAHLVGLHVVEPLQLSGYFSPAISGFVDIEAMEAIQDKHREAATAAAAKLEASFRAAADRAGISAEWRLVEGEVAEVASLHARYADLAVIGQIDPENPPPDSTARLPEHAVMSSGRPVLLVPYVGRYDTVGERVLVAWNAGREAARALNDALPLLVAAKQVTVLAVNPERGIAGEGDVPAADIALHLARHGVKAEAAYTVAKDIEVGDVILSRASDLGADLIVMGAYGHSRTREIILGGATRALFDHMTVPVLMSH